jgi:transposase
MSCAAIAKVLLDDGTIRTWHRSYGADGIEGLANCGYEGSACRLTEAQQDRLKAWITEALPRTTREIGAWIEQKRGIDYQGRSDPIALLHRLVMEHRKPKAVSRKLDPGEHAAFIKAHEDFLNHLDADEAAIRRCGASDARGAPGRVLGAERYSRRRGADQRAATLERR